MKLVNFVNENNLGEFFPLVLHRNFKRAGHWSRESNVTGKSSISSLQTILRDSNEGR